MRGSHPQFVEVYFPGESTKFPSKVRMTYAEATQAHEEKRGRFRDKRRKIVLAHQPHQPSESRRTAASLTGGSRVKGDGGDMHLLAGSNFRGGHLTRSQRERFIGWGLVRPAAPRSNPAVE